MRRTVLTGAAILAATLATAGAALAGTGNGGVTPQNAGTPAAQQIVHDYVFVGGFTLFIFVLVEGLLIAFVVKYRRGRRARTAEGYQIHGSTRLELMWTVGPALILAAIASFVLVNLGTVQGPPARAATGDSLHVTVEGHQFYWLFRYPNGAVSIDTMYAPKGRDVHEKIVAPDVDVNHSWWVPALGGKMDAIPGRVNETWFNAPRTGTYPAKCAELCGIQHAQMKADVVVQEPDRYRATARRLRAQLDSASPQLGKTMFDGVCEKCHRISGPRFIGPTLGGNPLLASESAVADIVRHGRGQMPAVGAGWSDRMVATLVAYTKRIAKGNVGSQG